MTMLAINADQAVQPRVTEGLIPHFGPLLMLLVRSAFILSRLIAMLIAYLHIRRLLPLIGAHWLMDFSNILFLYPAV